MTVAEVLFYYNNMGKTTGDGKGRMEGPLSLWNYMMKNDLKNIGKRKFIIHLKLFGKKSYLPSQLYKFSNIFPKLPSNIQRRYKHIHSQTQKACLPS